MAAEHDEHRPAGAYSKINDTALVHARVAVARMCEDGYVMDAGVVLGMQVGQNSKAPKMKGRRVTLAAGQSQHCSAGVCALESIARRSWYRTFQTSARKHTGLPDRQSTAGSHPGPA